MNKTSTNKKPFVYFVIIAIVFAIITAVCVIATKTEGFTQIATSFSATVNEKKLYAFSQNTILSYAPETEIFVEEAGFVVKVERAPGIDFDFKVDGKLAGFSGIDDFEKVFVISKSDKQFVVNTKLRSMTEILQAYFSTNEITDVPESNFNQTCFFVLKIISKDGTKEIAINLDKIGLPVVAVESITINQDKVIL